MTKAVSIIVSLNSQNARTDTDRFKVTHGRVCWIDKNRDIHIIYFTKSPEM
jgi:hypothetical protein